MVALVATSGVVWLSFRSRIVPFVIVTDNLGRPVASGLADQASTADEQFDRHGLAQRRRDKYGNKDYNLSLKSRYVKNRRVTQGFAIEPSQTRDWRFLAFTL
jgi:hypothetical protein